MTLMKRELFASDKRKAQYVFVVGIRILWHIKKNIFAISKWDSFEPSAITSRAK